MSVFKNAEHQYDQMWYINLSALRNAEHQNENLKECGTPIWIFSNAYDISCVK
jgi:hypothetical protein